MSFLKLQMLFEKHISPIAGDGVVLLGGVLLTLSFAPFNNPLLAIIALIILLLNWQHVSLGKAVWRGYLFGFGQFGTGIYWVYFGIHDWGGINEIISIGLSALLVAYLASYSALLGWLMVGYCNKHKVIRLLFVFPAAWGLLEWFRGWFLTGFPWLQLGYSQIDTPLSGLAPITGIYGVSWLVAFSSAALVAMCYFRDWRRWGVLCLLLSLWGTAQLLRSVSWTQPLGKPFQATLIQGNIPLQRKWLPEQRDDTLQTYASITRQHWDSSLIVWPETALPVIYNSLDPLFINTINAEAIAHRSDILLGVIASGERVSEFYNAMQLWGETKGTYYKRHLVPIGEYLPFQPVSNVMAELIGFPVSNFKKGADSQDLLYAAGYYFVASICYESVFGQELLMGLPEAAYLVNITDDGWWRNSVQPYQHLQMARFRALETGRYMLRSSATGITAFINEKGKVVSSLAAFKRAALTDSVVPMIGNTPYMWWGDALALAIFMLSMVLAFLLVYRARSH
ncbi:apolipoprotein N-acyltransferase [Methyloprofundus sp.]|uniref:apolipoprotein N-acyltransferase n=1 Tax=Methyloprofundus sp. TaxID=2020875 RepID=UPI003D0E0E16